MEWRRDYQFIKVFNFHDCDKSVDCGSCGTIQNLLLTSFIWYFSSISFLAAYTTKDRPRRGLKQFWRLQWWWMGRRCPRSLCEGHWHVSKLLTAVNEQSCDFKGAESLPVRRLGSRSRRNRGSVAMRGFWERGGAVWAIFQNARYFSERGPTFAGELWTPAPSHHYQQQTTTAPFSMRTNLWPIRVRFLVGNEFVKSSNSIEKYPRFPWT